MSKQDRQGARTAQDVIERYNFKGQFDRISQMATAAQKSAESAQQAAESANGKLSYNELFSILTHNTGNFTANGFVVVDAENNPLFRVMAQDFYGHDHAMLQFNSIDGQTLFGISEQVAPDTGEARGVRVSLRNHENQNPIILDIGKIGASISLSGGLLNEAEMSATENGITLNGKYVYWHDNGNGTYSLVGYDYGVPRITNLTVTRCDADRNPTPTGTYALLEFDWACDLDVTDIDIERTWDGGSTASSYSVSGKSGQFSKRQGSGNLSTDTAYTYTVTITVGMETTSVSVVVPATT